MPSTWDHKADKDLLLTIIEGQTLKSIDWKMVSAAMQQKSYTFSHEACRQHFQKIRKEARNSAGDGVFTPCKSSNGTKTTPASRRKASSFANEDGDDEEAFDTPTKKRKTKSAKKEETEDMRGLFGQTAAQFKIEEFEDGDENGHTNAPIDLVNDDIYVA